MSEEYKDKSGRILQPNDIVKLSDEWRMKTQCCRKAYGHIWKAEPWDESGEWEWVCSYNHMGSESSDRLKDIPPEHLEWCGVEGDANFFTLDFPETF